MIEVTPVQDYSRRSLRALAVRLQASRSLEELAYREAELGEAWSLVDGDRLEAEREFANATRGIGLRQLQSRMLRVYTLMTCQTDGSEAAAALRQIVLECAVLQSAPVP
jgi:hypothetical protein